MTEGGWLIREAGPLGVDEAIALVRSRGVEIGDDIRVVVDDDFMKPTDNAHYGKTFSSAESYTWAHMLGPGEKLFVRIRGDVLRSDDQTLFVLAHEMHEINTLRDMFAARINIPGAELIALVRIDRPGNLHTQANRVAGDLVLALRRERS